MKIAVSVDEEGLIAPHLGKCKLFHVFFKDGDLIELLEERKTEGNYQNHVIEDIMDCDYVISAQIGEGMLENLKNMGNNMGIIPVVEEKISDPFEAVKALKVE